MALIASDRKEVEHGKSNLYNMIKFNNEETGGFHYRIKETNGIEERSQCIAYISGVVATKKGKSIIYYDSFGIKRTVFLSTKNFKFWDDGLTR